MMISATGSSGPFGYRVRYKSILHNTYTGRRSNLRSKPTPIHVPVQKYDFNYSYSRSHFSRLSQAVAKKNYPLSQKVSNVSKISDPVINGFSPNDESSHLHIFDHLSVKFVIRRKFIGFSNTSHLDSLEMFRISVADKVKTDICILQRL